MTAYYYDRITLLKRSRLQSRGALFKTEIPANCHDADPSPPKAKQAKAKQ
jgi:hypothetical protein